MLAVNRASDWTEFRNGLDTFAVSAQNFVYADAAGNVGKMVTTFVPKRPLTPPADIVLPLSETKAWDTIVTPQSLPYTFDPADGFVASANEKRARRTSPAQPAMTPLRTKATNSRRATGMPTRSAAAGLDPMAYRSRPQRVNFRTSVTSTAATMAIQGHQRFRKLAGSLLVEGWVMGSG